MLMRRGFGALAALLLLAGCAGGIEMAKPDSATQAEAAWAQAYVILPGDATPQRLADAAPRLARLDAAAPLPVVLFAHGCRGLDEDAAETLRLIAAHGFAAIAPDHHARPDAHAACRGGPSRPIATPRPARRDGGYARTLPIGWSPPPEPAYVGRRLQEVQVALGHLRSLPWVDQAEVYLVGHSLGRGTAGLWPTRGLAAVAVLGQDCRGARAALDDLPVSVPLLPLADRRGGAAERARALHCGEFARRPVFSSMVLGADFAGQPTQPETQRALLDFLLGGG